MAVWDSGVRTTGLTHSHPWLAQVLFSLDSRLRRRHSVFEYTKHPSCVFRVDITQASRTLKLRDGTRLTPGQRIARLHLWTENVPPVPQSGATIAWARQMQRRMAVSLRELERYLAALPELDDVAAVCAIVPSATKTQREQLARIMGYYGFEAIAAPQHLSFSGRLHRFGENILISLIVLAHNAAALRLDTLNRVRLSVYLSRQTLEERFGVKREQAPTAVEAL